MVAKISVGSSLYGAIAYNGEKINEAQGRLLTTNRIYNDGSGTVDIGKAMEGFLTFLPPQMKIEKPVVHISLNPHPEDVLTDIELQNIAREYLEKLGFGNQPYPSIRNNFVKDEIQNINFSKVNIFNSKPKFLGERATNIVGFNIHSSTIYYEVEYQLKNEEWKIVKFKERRR